MKLYDREDFLQLKTPFVYSEYSAQGSQLLEGLFCNTETLASDDWIEQDLLSEHGFPLADAGIKDGFDNILHVEELRDNYKEFRTDLYCAGRNGLYDKDFKAIVWDKEDLLKLRDYIDRVLNSMQ